MIRLCSARMLRPRAAVLGRSLLRRSSRGYSWRNVRDKFNEFMDNTVGGSPPGFIPVALVGTNVIVYLLYKFQSGKNRQVVLNNPLLKDFLCPGLFSLGINSVFTFLLARNIESMHGPGMLAKVVALTVVLGALGYSYSAQHSSHSQPYGNNALMRGLGYSIMFSNPQASFILFPIPIPLKAWIVGGVILGFDLISLNYPGLGGTAAGFICSRLLI